MYAVAGVTGNTGAAVARTLLSRGAAVRGIARERARAAAWEAHGVEIAVADLRDSAALALAFQGARAAYVLNPPAYASDDLVASAEQIADAVAHAAEASGLGRLVVLSSIGAQLQTGHGNIRTNTLFDTRLARLGIPITFIRPAYFMQNWGAVARAASDGVLPSFLAPADRAIPMVSTADVGRIAALALLDDRSPRVIELAGPRDYAPADAAAAFGRALSRQVVPIIVPESEWPSVLTRTGFSARTIASWVELFRGFNSGAISFQATSAVVRGEVSLDQAVAELLESSRAPSLGVQA